MTLTTLEDSQLQYVDDIGIQSHNGGNLMTTWLIKTCIHEMIIRMSQVLMCIGKLLAAFLIAINLKANIYNAQIFFKKLSK